MKIVVQEILSEVPDYFRLCQTVNYRLSKKTQSV